MHVVVYSKDMHSLLEAGAENAYTNFRIKWDPVFQDYYINHTDPGISVLDSGI